MQMLAAISVLGLLVAYFTLDVVRKRQHFKRFLCELKHLNEQIRTWPVVSGTILRAGHNCEYRYPQYDAIEQFARLPEPRAFTSAEDYARHIKQKRAAALDHYERFGLVYLVRSYRYENTQYESRAISVVETEADILALKGAHPGATICVYVNPDDPCESYVRIMDDGDLACIKRLGERAILRKITVIAAGLALIVAIAIGQILELFTDAII